MAKKVKPISTEEMKAHIWQIIKRIPFWEEELKDIPITRSIQKMLWDRNDKAIKFLEKITDSELIVDQFFAYGNPTDPDYLIAKFEGYTEDNDHYSADYSAIFTVVFSLDGKGFTYSKLETDTIYLKNLSGTPIEVDAKTLIPFVNAEYKGKLFDKIMRTAKG
jgi:hypothetical protein